MQILVTVLFLIVAAINLAPVIGVVSAERLQGLYGVALEDPNLVILMRHRAILFGIVGGLLAVAGFHAPMRPTAIAAGLVSMVPYMLLAYGADACNAELRRIAHVDLFATVALIGAWFAGASQG